MADTYKVEQLKKMLEHETNETETHYGAHLTHWCGDSKPICLDAGALKVLIEYYSNPQCDESSNEANNVSITVDEILLDIKNQYEQEENCTSYGEPQAFIYLDNGRSIEIVHEEEGLSPENQFFSVRLECSEEEFENHCYDASCGVIESFVTANVSSPLNVEPLREAIKCLLKVNETEKVL